MKIYIDILIITNSILNLIYLETFAKIIHRKIGTVRLGLAALAGGFFSLILIFNGESFVQAIVITIIKWVCMAVTLLIASGFKNLWQFLKNFLIYIAIRAAYTGMILIYWQLSDSKRIYVRNYTAYFDISLIKLLIAVISAYIMLCVYEFIIRRYHGRSEGYKAVYSNGAYELTLPAVADSGNKLCDSFTGMPVVIFYCSEMYYHYNLQHPEMCAGGEFRYVPFNSVGGSGLIAVTPKGRVTIIDDKGCKTDVRCYAGVMKAENGKSRAIFNPLLIE